MAYILFGSDDQMQMCPFSQVSRINYQNNNNGDNNSVTITVYRVGRGESVVYSERGDESVVDAGQEVYRNILNGLESGTPVNLTDFSLVAPKKKAPSKKTEPEPESETPEPETPPETPAE